jgi:hypothetical protein
MRAGRLLLREGVRPPVRARRLVPSRMRPEAVADQVAHHPSVRRRSGLLGRDEGAGDDIDVRRPLAVPLLFSYGTLREERVPAGAERTRSG